MASSCEKWQLLRSVKIPTRRMQSMLHILVDVPVYATQKTQTKDVALQSWWPAQTDGSSVTRANIVQHTNHMLKDANIIVVWEAQLPGMPLLFRHSSNHVQMTWAQIFRMESPRASDLEIHLPQVNLFSNKRQRYVCGAAACQKPCSSPSVPWSLQKRKRQHRKYT